MLVMPLYAAIAWYGTGLRVHQYGLTPDRVFALLFTAVASLYAAGYAIAVLRRGRRFAATLARVNVASAGVVAALALAVQLPPLDPLRLSADDQARRLRSGAIPVEAFDFAALRFHFGRRGWERLLELESLPERADAATIRAAIARVRRATGYWEARPERLAAPAAPPLRVVPRGLTVPTDFGTNIEDELAQKCGEASSCLLIAADLDSDGALEYCAFGPRYWSRCYSQTAHGGPWRAVGRLAHDGAPPAPDASALEAELSAGAVPVRPSRYREIVLRDGALRFVPND